MPAKPRTALSIAVVLLPASMPAVAGQQQADCSVTSVGFVPLDELGPGLYLGQFPGGLYPGGINEPPLAHHAEGRSRALGLLPLDNGGEPNPAGRIVLLSIGMSNTTQEFCSQDGFLPCDAWTFMGQAATDPRVDQVRLTIANGAKGGQAALAWDDPSDQNYDRVQTEVLEPQGLSEAQVQVVWIKQANPQPTVALPNLNSDAFNLLVTLGDIVRAVQTRYPNCQVAFLSSRIYAGYAGYPVPIHTLTPEPYAYESGFSVKWLIEAQINQMATGSIDPLAGDLDYDGAAPWLAWGPYLWADGEAAGGDGLQWFCDDFQNDGTHPAMTAEEKVGTMLLDFMVTSPFATPWFRRCELGDMNIDGLFDGGDIAPFVDTFLAPEQAPPALRCAADCDDNGSLGAADVPAFVEILLEG